MTERHIQTEAHRQQAELTEALKRLRQREIDDLRKVLAIPQGRRLLWRILAEARIFRRSYASGAANSETFFNEGRRDLGLMVLEEINQAKPDAFSTMQHEAMSDPLALAVAKAERGST